MRLLEWVLEQVCSVKYTLPPPPLSPSTRLPTPHGGWFGWLRGWVAGCMGGWVAGWMGGCMGGWVLVVFVFILWLRSYLKLDFLESLPTVVRLT